LKLRPEEPQQRRFIGDRAVPQILGGFAGPLKLGTMNQGLTHFILDDHWANHFARLAAQQGGGAMTVKRLRALIDQPLLADAWRARRNPADKPARQVRVRDDPRAPDHQLNRLPR
jgi:hypothetical protein